jgi:phage RecT family recombinase
MTQQNAITKVDNEAGSFLQKFGKSLEQYAVRKYSRDTFLKSAMLAIVSNPDLVECLKTEPGKLSLFSALRYAATTGLSLNPQEGKAALIAYSGRVQYQTMKNGLIELSLESGKIENLIAEHVRINDQFRIVKTSDGDKFEFEPALDDRGGVRGFFAAIKFKDGLTYVKWMSKSEVEEVRDKYGKGVFYSYDDKHGKFKKGDRIPDSAWGKSFIGMGEKTVMRKLLKSISISEETDNLIANDDFYEVDFKIEPGIDAENVNKKLTKKKPPSPPKPADNEKQEEPENKSDGESLL